MADSVSLSCPSCGEKLRIGPEIDRFACCRCGSEYVVRRGGGIVSLAPADECAAAEGAATEVAIARLESELAALMRRREQGVDAPPPRRPQPPTQRDRWRLADSLVRMGLLAGILGLALGLVMRRPTVLVAAVALTGAAVLGNWLKNKIIDRDDARFAAQLAAFDGESAERAAMAAAKSAQLDAEIAAKSAELRRARQSVPR